MRTTLVGVLLGSVALGSAACTSESNAGRPAAPSTAVSNRSSAADSPATPDLPACRERALSLLVVVAQTGLPEERCNALEALIPTPARLAAVVEPALLDDVPAVRAVAAMAAGRAKLVASANAIAPLATDRDPMVRASALFALRMCGQSPDLTPIADLLSNLSPRLRAHAAYLLGEVGEKSALGPLRDAARQNLNRANPAEVRVMDLQIAEARVKLGDETALADIRTALFPSRTEDLEAAALAAQIVGEIKDQAAVNQLIQLATGKDSAGQQMPPEVRLAAAGALALLDREPRKARFIALEYFAGEKDALRAQSAYVFGVSRDSTSLGILFRMMSDPVVRVRVAAAAAIVRMAGGVS